MGWPYPGIRTVSAPNWQFPFLDFPTAWWFAPRVVHTDRRCSWIQEWGGFLCDCGAIEKAWRQAKATRGAGT